MMNIKRIKLKDIKKFLGKIPLILGKNAFFSFLGLFALCLIIGGFVVYKNYLSLEEVDPQTVKQFKFHSKTYQQVLDVWQEKEKRLKETDFKYYSDPFNP